ncbi:MAG: YidC/Oxa1 family membrane protein insertase [Planctomycetota bacterium]
MTDDAGQAEDQGPRAVSEDEAGAPPPKPPWPLVGPDVDVKRLTLIIVICLGGLIYFFWDDVRDVIQPPEIVATSVPADALNPEHEVKVNSGALGVTFSKIGAAITGLTWTNPQDGHAETLISQDGAANRALAVELPGREKSAGGAFKLMSKTERDGITAIVFRNDDFGDGLVLAKTFRIHSDKPLIELDVEINDVPMGDPINERGYGLRISNAVGLPEELSKDDPLISVRSDQIVDHHPVRRVSGTRGWPNEDERKRAGHSGVEGIPTLEWVATASKYFGLIVRPDKPMPGAMMTFTRTGRCAAAVTLLVTPRTATRRVSNTFHVYAGPKEYDALSGLPGRQQESINYWYFGRLATVLLKLVHDKTVANYGLAIIIVTLIFRVLMWPVTRYNLRAMVDLKLANAKLADVDAREPPRAEDDAKEWLEELLPLKEAGAARPAERRHARTEWLKDQLAADTPPDELRKLIDDTGARVVWLKEMRGEWLKGARVWEKVQSRATIGAFLPMVILLPILLVLYYTLNAGYEFYRQPLALWITDISSRDPFFVLPVLMGLAMMAQFRTMSENPQSERSWILMPAAFTIIFAFFSAGLVLFWFVDTLAGWLQVALIKRGKKRKEAAAAAAAGEA